MMRKVITASFIITATVAFLGLTLKPVHATPDVTTGIYQGKGKGSPRPPRPTPPPGPREGGD